MAKTPGVVASCSCHAFPTPIAPFLSFIPHLATFLISSYSIPCFESSFLTPALSCFAPTTSVVTALAFPHQSTTPLPRHSLPFPYIPFSPSRYPPVLDFLLILLLFISLDRTRDTGNLHSSLYHFTVSPCYIVSISQLQNPFSTSSVFFHRVSSRLVIQVYLATPTFTISAFSYFLLLFYTVL